MSALLEKYSENKHKDAAPASVDCLQPGQPCCAQYEYDMMWYRAKIVRVVDTDNVEVRFNKVISCQALTSRAPWGEMLYDSVGNWWSEHSTNFSKSYPPSPKKNVLREKLGFSACYFLWNFFFLILSKQSSSAIFFVVVCSLRHFYIHPNYQLTQRPNRSGWWTKIRISQFHNHAQ